MVLRDINTRVTIIYSNIVYWYIDDNFHQLFMMIIIWIVAFVNIHFLIILYRKFS